MATLHLGRLITSTAPSGATLATPEFTAGWATFGLPLAQGDLPAGQSVRVGSLTTQAEVKTTYPDGSARFLVVTAKPTGSGPQAIVSAAPSAGTFTPTVPTASIAFDVQERFAILGTYTIASGTLVVKLANDVTSGLVLAGAIRINPSASPSTVTVKNAGDAGFSTVGTWTSVSGTGYKQQGVRYTDGTDGSRVASWTFTGLAAGDYRVAAQWTNYSIFAYDHTGSATFRVYDDATLVGTSAGHNMDHFPPADIKDRTTFTATLPAGVGTDNWLSGPLVREWRRYVTPVDGSSNPHPWLRVFFDVRVYNDDSAKVWVMTENCLNVAVATMVPYDVTIVVNGSTVLSQADIKHWVTARWSKRYGISLSESTVTEDWTPFWRSHALVKYDANTSNTRWRINGGNSNENDARWGILQRGGLSINQMNNGGGRPELGYFPDWIASYIAHKGEQKDWTIESAYYAGSNPVHIREPDGSLWFQTNHPTFWFDERGKGVGLAIHQPKLNLHNGQQDVESGDDLFADRSHLPDYVYPAYIMTGDRILYDEMRDYANYNTQNLSNASDFRQEEANVRGMAWPLRWMAEARAFLVDGDPAAGLLADNLANSLAWYDQYAQGLVRWIGSDNPPGKFLTFALDYDGEIGASFESAFIGGGFSAYDGQLGMYSLWQQSYLIYAIQRCNDLGFIGGLDLQDRMTGFICRLHDPASGWPANHGCTYYPIVGTRSGSTWTMDTTMAQVYAHNAERAGSNPNAPEWGQLGWPWDRYATNPSSPTWPSYGAIERMSARIAYDRGLAHSALAKAELEDYVATTGFAQDSDNISYPWY